VGGVLCLSVDRKNGNRIFCCYATQRKRQTKPEDREEKQKRYRNDFSDNDTKSHEKVFPHEKAQLKLNFDILQSKYLKCEQEQNRVTIFDKIFLFRIPIEIYGIIIYNFTKTLKKLPINVP